MRRIWQLRVVVMAALVGLAVAGCSSGGNTNNSASTNNNGPVTLTWWHNGTADPLKSVWQQAADDYHAAHPNVSFQISPIQNEQFQTKVPLALQSNDPPDVYQQWGSGQEATQVTSGKVADLTSAVSGWIGQLGRAASGWQVDGKQYGVPYDLHAVGFWYRKDIFARAGITSPPSTMDDLNADVAKLKQAGVAPIALGGKDRWPDAFYWEYFSVRECSAAVMRQSISDKKLSDPCWIKAGQDVQSFLATNPFQNGFLGAPAQQGAGSSAGLVVNGQAAMELQGDWEPGVMASLTTDKNFADKLGWFPFPSVRGGHGDPSAVLGGGDGFSCTTRAAAACADFLKYIDSTPVQQKIAAAGVGLPVNSAAVSSLPSDTERTVLNAYHHAAYVQTYLDIALPTSVGQALNDAVANFFAGQGTPQSVANSVAQASTGDR